MVEIIRLEEWECLSVEIEHHVISTGWDDTGKAFVAAEMSLGGLVLDTRHGCPTPNTSVHVHIRFSAEQQYDDEVYDAADEDLRDGTPEGYDPAGSYIGHITMSVLPVVELHRGSDGSSDFARYFRALDTPPPPNAGPGERRLSVYMNVFLPLSVFPVLMAMKGTRIKLSTAHDSLLNPKKKGSLYVAAFVKRAFFEPMKAQ